jgi:hypothetical protein
MPMLVGSTVSQSRAETIEAIRAAPGQAANVFAFMHWVGDEDRGLADVFLVKNELILIDNGLCGPGRDCLVRGAHPNPEVYRANSEALVKKCYPGKQSLVAFVFRDSGVSAMKMREPKAIENIEAIPDRAVTQMVQVAGLPSWIGEVLILRKPLLRSSYLEWLSQAIQVCSPR